MSTKSPISGGLKIGGSMKNCKDCHWCALDPDMDFYCSHPNASVVGTDVNTMRKEVRTKNMRGEPCGPKAKYFKPRKAT